MSRAVIVQADARHLPLEDSSVDLIMTSPPYWQLRAYMDAGEIYDGQIGMEPTWQEYIDHMLECTQEWMRVLKPSGSLFVNIGDKMGGSGCGPGTNVKSHAPERSSHPYSTGKVRPKSLMGMPWRYAFACTDELNLILRAEIIWHKPSALPESVRDRVSRCHEQVFHFTKEEHYYAATDLIRVPQADSSIPVGTPAGKTYAQPPTVGGHNVRTRTFKTDDKVYNPLGKALGSVWTLPAEPLNIPGYVEGRHYAAFPTSLVRPAVLGFSPERVCTVCGQGRFPVVMRPGVTGHDNNPVTDRARNGMRVSREDNQYRAEHPDYIAGWACDCTPYTDHPENRRPGWDQGFESNGHPSRAGGEWRRDGGVSRHKIPANGEAYTAENYERLPIREYHWDGWEPPPATPGVVLDPFGGTGTTALVAVAHGRTGISNDAGADYCDMARYRTRDGAERVKARGEPAVPKAKRRHEHLYGSLVDDLDAIIGGS